MCHVKTYYFTEETKKLWITQLVNSDLYPGSNSTAHTLTVLYYALYKCITNIPREKINYQKCIKE